MQGRSLFWIPVRWKTSNFRETHSSWTVSKPTKEARWQRMAFHYRIPHIPDGFYVTGWFCFCEIKKYSHKKNCGASTWTLWNTAKISAWHEGLKRAKQLNSYCFRHNIQYEPGNEYRELSLNCLSSRITGMVGIMYWLVQSKLVSCNSLW